MNVLQIMGCTSDQYGSMERYLVEKAAILEIKGGRLTVTYENEPVCADFIIDFKDTGGDLLKFNFDHSNFYQHYRHLKEIIWRKKIDVVHAYFTPTCHYVMAACATYGFRNRFRTSANLPLTLFRHHKGIGGYNEQVFRLKQRFLARLPRRIICRSQAIKNEFLDMGVPKHKLAVASGGTNTVIFHEMKEPKEILKERLGMDKNKIIIGTACRLVPEKSIDDLIDAAMKLADTRSKIFFVILGDGPDKTRLMKKIVEGNAASYIKMAGHQSNIVPWLNAFDLFVLPSRAEGMSNAVLEAMSCSLPVILSDIPPNVEIFGASRETDRYIGEVFKTGDASSLAEKIILLLGRDDWYDIGTQARDLVQERFSVSARIECELNVYRGVL